MARLNSRFTLFHRLPLLSLVVISHIAVLVDGQTHFPEQIGISLTVLLTLVAFKFSIVSELPKINYMTWSDLFVTCILLYIMAFISLLGIFNYFDVNHEIVGYVGLALALFWMVVLLYFGLQWTCVTRRQ